MPTQRRRFSFVLMSLVPLLLLAVQPAAAAIIYVDNRFGDDRFDGTNREAVSVLAGPVRTIRRALFLARHGDTIEIANHGIPYYEQLSLSGRHHSGIAPGRFTINGNGAVVSGARLVPPFAWEAAGRGLWRFAPKRKGHFQLILNDKAVPELTIAPEVRMLPAIPAGRWAAWRGAIYYQAAGLASPATQPFAFADGGVGLTLTEVHDVVIIGLTFRHFRLDGVSAHSLCRNIVLDDVHAHENGRAGLFVGGASQVRALHSTFTGNRLYNVLIRDTAALRTEPVLPEPPTFFEGIAGPR